ncbi:hypothetical protein I307_02732 [Cryptococcus deuterogattii 99/473]|uniref:Uncharacterized protein n=1 Tax=Cryptococcus deuterogattii Ram5 TaxID=1296110 RepID=A0A0D0TSR2_9TREE|nr:hypothetical protein I313_05286 [Cryptococcus deuterogattii Ram5]KIY57659.1 hypothetical protein I307_02732 [Cryptococcus deuterogattii 99/473]
MSALGLTNSPLPSRSKDPSPVGSTPPSPSRRPAIRASASKSSLGQEATTNAAARVVAQQQSAKCARMSRQRASQVDLREDVVSYQTTKPPTPAKSPSTRPSVVKSTSVFQDAQHPAQRRAAQITTRTNLVTRKAVPSPAHTGITLADEWEAELVKDAQKLTLGPSSQKPDVVREPLEQRPNDGEWERFGQETSTATEEEDRRRREPGREVAFPPSMPRTPIRAVAAGVTSVHVGVRPRLHPSRASESMLRNQPDVNVPNPLFSSATANLELSGEETHPSYTAKHTPNLLKKAQKEYEDWLARKAEREGDMESGGMRNWEPKERAIARPSGLSPQSANSLHSTSPAELPPTDMASWTYGYPHSQSQTGISEPQEPQGHTAPPQSEDQQAAIDIAQRQVMIPYGHEAFYAHPAYWDPSYWWGMYGDPNAMAVHATNPSTQDPKSTNQVDMPKEGEMAPEEQQAYGL